MVLALVGFGIGLPEIAILLVVVLLIFGPSKLPALGEGIGKMLRGFKKEMKAMDEDKEKDKGAGGELAEGKEADDHGEIDVTPKPAAEPSEKKVG